MKTAILTPLEEELAILVSEIERFGLHKQKLKLGKIKAFEFRELDLLIACGGHGKTQFGIQAQYLFCKAPQIDFLICAGAAGALSNSLNIGDVVVATSTIEHDFNLKFVSRPLPNFAGNHLVIEILQNLPKISSAFSIHFGAIASGDEDIIDTVRRKELMNSTNCIAVAWEGAGGARACKFNQKHYLELRGITDTANHQAAIDFETNLMIAMHNIAEILVQWRGNLQ